MTGITVGAPTGGWNALNSLAEMPQSDAIVLENLIPTADSVKSRRGHVAHLTTARTNAHTLVSYNGATPKLLLGGAGNIYDITASGAGTDLTSGLGAFTNNKWQTTNYKDKLLFCNGADTPLEYDGSTVSQMTITGPTSSELIGCVTFKGRVFYWEGSAGSNPQSFWYAAAGAYKGAVTEFALDEFTSGGSIVSCFGWTHDGGQGLDDHFCVLMSTGEILVYAGSDPGDATDWWLVGTYKIGRPLGDRPVTQVGGDAIILTVDGAVTLSAAIQEGRYNENSAFSFKITRAASDAAQAYGDNFGWEGTLAPDENLFVINVPISGTNSVQFVRNTTTGAWCKFTGLNATAWCAHNGNLYFAATDGKAYKYQGVADLGSFIPYRCTQAYTHMGDPRVKKQVTGVEIFSNYAYPKHLHSKFWADFNEKSLPAIADPPEPSPGEWDSGQWDAAEWDAGVLGTRTSLRQASGFGFFLSHTLRLKSRAQRFIWYGSRYLVKTGGVI